MTDKEFFKTMAERGYKTKKSIADAFDIPYTTVSKWGCSSTAPDYVKKLILNSSESESESESQSQSQLSFNKRISNEQLTKLTERELLILELSIREFWLNSVVKKQEYPQKLKDLKVTDEEMEYIDKIIGTACLLLSEEE